MPFKENTITLHDVELIFGISCYDGIVDAQYSCEPLVGIVHSDLGISYNGGGTNVQDISYVAEDPRS